MIALVVAVVTSIIALAIALVVYLNNHKSATNLSFAGMVLFIGLYPLFNHLALQSGDPGTALNWAKAVLYTAIPVGPLFFIFAKAFPSPAVPRSKLVIALVAWSALNIVLAALGLIFAGVTIVGGQPNIVAGPAIASFGALQMLSVAGAAIALATKFRHAKGIARQQIKYLALSIGLGLVLTLTATIFLPFVLGYTGAIAVSPVFLLFAAVGSAYAILRHRLLDIRVVVARSVAYTIVIGVILIAYTGAVLSLGTIFAPGSVTREGVAIYGVLALVIAVTYAPFTRLVQRLTDGLFYKNRYDSNAFLAQTTQVMASTIDIDQLARRTIAITLRMLHVTRAALVLRDGDHFSVTAQEGYGDGQAVDLQACRDMAATGRRLVVDEETDERLRQAMGRCLASVVIPLRINDQLNALLVLGEKQSGELFSDTDIEVLEILGPELAVAIENTRSYKQIQQFNVKLEREIAKATKQLRLANDELQTKNAQLEALDHLKDEFISITSHELRTPLTAIRGYLWMALHGKKKDDQYDLYMDRAYTSTERLIGLVNDSLDVARIESGRVELNPEPTALRALSEEVVAELASRATERRQTVTVIGGRGVFAAWCDPNKIHQVLVNLLGNALKFTPEGGAITIRLSVIDGRAVVAVGDNGPGIAPEDQAKLFQKFSRIENNLSSVPGTGLGLYLCKQIIELSGGTIGLQSAVGKGSVFSFSLPLADATARPGASAKHRQSTLTIPAV